MRNLFFIVFFMFSIVSFAQVTPNPKDTLYNKGKLKVADPKSILEAYTYDAATDRYIYSKTFDGFNINYPIVLTPKQYLFRAKQCEIIFRKNPMI
jgi:hypothetical protein